MHKDVFILVFSWKAHNEIIHYFCQGIIQLNASKALNSHGTLIKWPFWKNERNNVLTSSSFPERKERALGRENSMLETTASNLTLLEHKTQREERMNRMIPGVVARWQMASVYIIHIGKLLKNFKSEYSMLFKCVCVHIYKYMYVYEW